jgi:hypothetical protein
MPYTMEDFEREVEQKVLNKLTPERLLERWSPEQILEKLPQEAIEKYLKKKQPSQDQDTPGQPGTPS